MDSVYVMRVWVILALVVCPSLQFSIRRRSASSYQNENPYDLHKALTALDRQRRRIEDADFFRQRELNNNNFVPLKKRTSLLSDGNYRDSDSDPEIYIPVRESDLSELLSAYEDPYRFETIPVDADQYHTEPSLNELQQIFLKDDDENGSDDVEESNEQLTSVTGGDGDKASEFVEEDISEDETEPENKEQIDTLLESADELEHENPNDLSKEDKMDNTQEVSDEELETVFSNNDNSEETGPVLESTGMKRSSGDFNSRDDTAENKYKLLKKFLENTQMKKRRMTKRDEKSGFTPTEDDLLIEIMRLRNEIEKMKLTQAMEDKENDYLASALKGATLSQLEGSDAFLKGEFDDIQNAIKLEELLQTVRIEDNDEDEVDGNVYDEQPKRAEPPPELDEEDNEILTHRSKFVPTSVDDSLVRWYDHPVVDEVDGGAFMKPALYDNYDDDTLMLENFVKQYSPQSKKTLEPVTDLEEAEFDEGLKNVNEILTDMTPQEREDLRYQIENILTYPDTHEQCTAASLLSSGCRFADQLQLPIDDEARRLCVRHEICYVCAETIGMTAVQCDNGYRGDAMEICGENEKCDEDASLFLGLMQEKHRYIPYRTEFCSAPCINDFIIGL